MVLYILRVVFILVMAGVAMSFADSGDPRAQAYAVTILIAAIGLAIVATAVDLLIPQKSLAAVLAVFFGLIIGLMIAYGIFQVLNLLIEVVDPSWAEWVALVNTIKIFIGVVCCYLAISFVLQTKDDFRFVIPYVEFAKQVRGARPLILDTSVIVDGRFADICETGIVDAPIVIPRFVLNELQAVADSSDRLKRNRGRRGLDVLRRLQSNTRLEVRLIESHAAENRPVDERLVILAQKMDGRVVTNDYNLNKVAQLHGVAVININDLANALKPVFLPGEALSVKIIKPGEEPGQGVGYLDDGTMVVVEAARDRIGQTVGIHVTSVLQTSAGRMIFGRIEGAPPVERPRRAAAST